MRQSEYSLSTASTPRRRVTPRAGTIPMWDDRVRVQVPDDLLAAAVAEARAVLSGRPMLGVPGAVPGVGRLARRLAAQAPDDDRLARLLGVLRSQAVDGVVVDGNGGLDAAATAVLGVCEAAQHDPRAWERVAAFARRVRERIDDRDRPAMAAGLLEVLTHCLASRRPDGLHLLPVLPDDWFGEDVSVHHLPLAGGAQISWSVTWPDDWPRLSWATSAPAVRITAPGLAPGWSTGDWRGSADLAPDVR